MYQFRHSEVRLQLQKSVDAVPWRTVSLFDNGFLLAINLGQINFFLLVSCYRKASSSVGWLPMACSIVHLPSTYGESKVVFSVPSRSAGLEANARKSTHAWIPDALETSETLSVECPGTRSFRAQKVRRRPDPKTATGCGLQREVWMREWGEVIAPHYNGSFLHATIARSGAIDVERLEYGLTRSR
jgi:hypothetical protein